MVLKRPTPILIQHFASSSLNPIAFNILLGLPVSDEQVAPEENAIFRILEIKESALIPLIKRLRLPGNRFSLSPFNVTFSSADKRFL